MNKKWTTYIVRCSDGSLYTGITTDVFRRVRQHNGELVGGSRYCAARRPVELVWKINCGTQVNAMAVERFIKNLRKKNKEKIASGEDFSIPWEY